MPRRILPIPPTFPIARLVARAQCVEPLGVWLEVARPPVRLVVPGPGGRRLLLFAADLGVLLSAASRVAVWDGTGLRVIAARSLARARRLGLRAGGARGPGAAVDALVGAARQGRAAPGGLVARPIDCVGEGRLA